MPKEIDMQENEDEEVSDLESISRSDKSDAEDEADSKIKSRANQRRSGSKNIQNKNRSNEFDKCPFELVETMSKHDKIIINYYYDSDKSEQSSEQQKIR